MKAREQIREDVEAARDWLVSLAETDTAQLDRALGLIWADEPDDRAWIRAALLRIAAVNAELRCGDERRDDQEDDET